MVGLGEIRLCTNEAMTESLAYYARHRYAVTHRVKQDGFTGCSSANPID